MGFSFERYLWLGSGREERWWAQNRATENLKTTDKKEVKVKAFALL